jgi:hypothetical protein
LDARGAGVARLRLGDGFGGGIAWLVLVYCFMVGWFGGLGFGAIGLGPVLVCASSILPGGRVALAPIWTSVFEDNILTCNYNTVVNIKVPFDIFDIVLDLEYVSCLVYSQMQMQIYPLSNIYIHDLESKSINTRAGQSTTSKYPQTDQSHHGNDP